MKHKRKRGAPKAKPIKVSPRSIMAPALALQLANVLRDRLLDFEEPLTPREREHIARDWHPKRKGKRGRPKPPAWIARPKPAAPAKSLLMARFFIWRAFYGRAPGDRRGMPEAERAVMQAFKCTRSTWQRHATVALNYLEGQWWPAACRLARKKKFEKFRRF